MILCFMLTFEEQHINIYWMVIVEKVTECTNNADDGGGPIANESDHAGDRREGDKVHR